MEYTNNIKIQLQDAVNLLSKAKRFEEQFMVIAQRLGLQGEKRRLRYESAVNHNLINFIICNSFDVYGISITSDPQNNSVPNVSTIEDFYTNYLAKMENQYDKMHEIANILVTSNCQHMAKYLYDRCRSLIEDIKYYRRTIMEGDAVKWNPEFIFLHQTTQCNIHDYYEEKEKSVGYDY